MRLLDFWISKIRDSQPVAGMIRIAQSRIRIFGRSFTGLKGSVINNHAEGELTMSEELSRELERVKGRDMTPEEVEAQRVSFVYGNAPADDHGTKETVRKSLELA